VNQLVDRFGRAHTYLRISVTDRCNLRCSYCMPEEEMVWKERGDILSYEEIVRIAEVAVGMGVEKIRVTGGEPLVRADIERLLVRLAAIEGLRSVALTTNAVLLARKLPAIRTAVDSINISLDTFRRDRFTSLTRRDNLDDVLAGIDAALDAGYRNLKVNAVMMRGVNDDELLDFVAFTAERPVAVRFIEFMPFAGNQWSAAQCLPMSEMLDAISTRYDLERIPDGPSPISRDFTVVDRSSGQRHMGSVGVIASMSTPFCDSCSRLRLTAEGMIMPCLHSPLEFDVRRVIRSGGDDAAIADVFLRALGAKPKEHPSAEELLAQEGRVMIQIGG
jgi:GTP 3',8-cyclase